jgi:hypothetical protein
MVLVGWMAFSGLLFAGLAFALGLPILPSLAASGALIALLLWFWSRDIPAPDLHMRESLWNTPEDDDGDGEADLARVDRHDSSPSL